MISNTGIDRCRPEKLFESWQFMGLKKEGWFGAGAGGLKSRPPVCVLFFGQKEIQSLRGSRRKPCRAVSSSSAARIRKEYGSSQGMENKSEAPVGLCVKYLNHNDIDGPKYDFSSLLGLGLANGALYVMPATWLF